MKCTKCNYENPDGAKFCANCGNPVQVAIKTCPQCGTSAPVNANFCGNCQYKFGAYIPDPEKNDTNQNVELKNGYVTWKIAPGQLAVKIDEQEMAAYTHIKGVYVAPGTIALFFVNGRYTATLESGSYTLDALSANENDSPAPAVTFLKKLARHMLNGIATLFGGARQNIDAAGNKVFYSVVLVRGSEFPLVYQLENLYTRGARSNIGLHVLCQIENFNDFFNKHLVDKKFVSIETFSKYMEPIVKSALNQELPSVASHEVDDNTALTARVLTQLQNGFAELYPCISIKQVLRLTSSNEAISEIRKLHEELYIADETLQYTQKRNDFLNRMTAEENRSAENLAKTNADHVAAMARVARELALTEDEEHKFYLMLDAERELREARTELDTELALNKLEASRALSTEELDVVKAEIKQRKELKSLEQGHLLRMTAFGNDVIYQREQLAWQLELGDKQAEMRLRNTKAEIEVAKAQAEFSDYRRDVEFAHRKEEDAHKMDLLKQAVAMRAERENAEHRRRMEEMRTQNEHEAAMLHTKATMSAEQIMALNPNASRDVAAALAEKYKAEAQVAQNSATIQMMQEHNAAMNQANAQRAEDMKEIALKQMELTQNIMLMQSSMKDQQIADRERQNQIYREDARHNQDNLIDGVRTTVSVMGNPSQAVASAAPASRMMTYCTNCGSAIPSGNSYCPKCGQAN